MKATQKNLLMEQTNLIKFNLARTQETANYVKQLLINPATALLAAESGINLNMTIPQMNQALATGVQRQEVRGQTNKLIAQGYEPVAMPQFVSDKSNLVTFNVEGQNLTFRKPPERTPSGTGGTDNDVDTYARAFNAGQITAPNIPQKIRGQVLARAKELALIDLKEDIQTGVSQNKFKDVNGAVSQLRAVYPEFTKEEIEREVNQLFKPDTQPQQQPNVFQKAVGVVGSFFSRLFGK